MNKHSFLAFDLGATSGRSIAAHLTGDKLEMKELTRFPNTMINVRGHLHWDIFSLFEHLKEGLRAFRQAEGCDPESIGIDTWGVDFGLLASDGSILGIPYAYRDSRTDGMMDEFFKLIPRDKVYELTGIQFMQLNSLYQLFAMKKANSSLLNAATDLLFIPDLLNYLFTGVKKSEFTFATTSQLFNPKTRTWEKSLFDAMGVDMKIMQEIVLPGTIIGKVSADVAQETGAGEIPVVSVALHDTGSAIAAVPAEGANWAYLSSGTWSLMGIETREALINARTSELNFTNEGGVEGTYRFLKNITGMWLLEQCRKVWSQAKKDFSYPQLVEMAQAAKPFQCLVDPDAPDFMAPADMTEAIRQYCVKTGQHVPASEGEFVRCIFDSLALKYLSVLDMLREVSPNPIEKLHVIGGGSKNAFLNQLTANAIGLPVLAGPSEATALGNVMVQAMALGVVKSLAEIRQVISKSVQPDVFNPQDTTAWEAAYQQYQKVTK
ncbi:MAG: rhamnulokinase [Bacteroidota bacterium]|nr:rhamnulokinase [Bacteroidota bacterium]